MYCINENNELIKLSLLRSTDLISGGDPKAWGVKDNLMIGTVNLSFAIMPFDGNDSLIPAKEQNINSQPMYYFDSTDLHMFTGGRPVVQDGDVGELYFPKDKYENMNLPHKKGILKISDDVCVTALKKAETTDSVILRAYNPSEDNKENVLELSGKELFKTNLAETIQESFENCIGKKEIKTVLIK